jgi:hypothetical protein
MEAALQPGQAAQCVGVQTSGAPDMVTGKARSGLRYMWATAVSVLPSSGKRSKLRRGIVRGGRSGVTPTVTVEVVQFTHDYLFLDYVSGVPAIFIPPPFSTSRIGPSQSAN